MLFFAGFFMKINIRKLFFHQKVSLQVHEYTFLTPPARRVHPCASGFQASMTAEAAIALPLAIFFFLALLQPVSWLDRQRKVQTCTERIGEEISQYGLLMDTDSEEENSGLPAFCTDAAAALWIRGRVGQYADHVLVKQAEVYGENGDITFEVEYREDVPFYGRILGKQQRNAAVKRRTWIGLRGKLRGNGTGLETDRDSDEEIVYVGAGMGRYHLFRDCHYISNEYQSVTQMEAEKGGSYGKKRTPCAVCAGKENGSGIVYVTAAGEHYHFDKNCASMISYVREMPRGEAEHLGLCSYCARKKGELE